MRWDENHQSPDVIDDRNRRTARGPSGNLAFGLLQLGSRFGWKGIVVAVLLLGGIYAFQFVGSGLVGSTPEGAADNDQKLKFVSFVVDDVQATWDRELPGYTHAKLVLFRDATRTGCGFGDAASGPFYCPDDQQVYLDLAFYDELSERFGAPGDFAQAYVIAHEFGHHVQHLQGTDRKARRGGAEGADSGSVRLELQADCYAGVWAASAKGRGILEQGDLEEGLRAASAIGDDRLQRQSGGVVTPDSFTHGTSEQRVTWLRRGFESGRMSACDTFSAQL